MSIVETQDRIKTFNSDVDPRRTHIFLKNPRLVIRLRSEASRQDRSIRSIVTCALEEYFQRIDEQRDYA